MFGRGFFFMRFIMFIVFVGFVALACGGLYNLGFTRGYSQGVLISGAESGVLPPAAPFYSPPPAGPGPFLAMGGVLLLGFLALITVGLIFGRRKWARARHWQYDKYRHGGPHSWRGAPWEERESPSEESSPEDRTETFV